MAFVSIALVALLAGCTSAGGSNKAPMADLIVSPATAWNTESITFDGRSSSDPDGRITSWHFDFADGQKADASSSDGASTTHTYARGGVYKATLTVTDDGASNGGALSATDTKTVSVNERNTVPGGAVASAPVSQDVSQTFPVSDGGKRFDLNLNLTNTIAVGSSVIQVSFLNPDGSTLTSQTVTLSSAGQVMPVTLNGNLAKTGDYKVVVHANSGSATVAGQERTYYV